MKSTLRIDEAAGLMNVHADTVRRALIDGKIAFVLTPGGHRRALTSSVKNFLMQSTANYRKLQ